MWACPVDGGFWQVVIQPPAEPAQWQGLTSSWCCLFIGSSGQLFLFCPGICLPFTSTHCYFYPWRLILRPRLLVISFHYLANCYTCNDFFFFFKLKKDFDCTVFIMAQGLFLVACFSCGGGSRVCGLSSSCLRASLVATCGFNCSVACEILVFQPGIEPVFPGR